MTYEPFSGKAFFMAGICLISFYIGREYEYNKLRETYVSEIRTDPYTKQIIEKRIFYR